MLSSYSVLVNLNRGTLHKFHTLSTKNVGLYYFRTPDLFKNNVPKLFLALKIDENFKKFKVQTFFYLM